jgi:chemotaxis protein methyltransferase CheR
MTYPTAEGLPAKEAPNPLVTVMSDREFQRFSVFIHEECGIKMPPAKKAMVQTRLQKRLRLLGMTSFSEYADFVFSSEGMQTELIAMIDVVTTNKTDFFREPGHFDYLTGTAVPELIGNIRVGIQKKLMVWSAGCSTGEEPYTLAMVLGEFAERCPGFDFTILATDISTQVLEKAKAAIYDAEKVAPVPASLKTKYLLRSKDRSNGTVRIVPELRSRIRFRRLNFMDGDFGMREPMDVIFCRNVIIYFDRRTQETLLNRLCSHLIPGGYLFMGHSETLNGMDLPLTAVSSSVYRRSNGRE